VRAYLVDCEKVQRVRDFSGESGDTGDPLASALGSSFSFSADSGEVTTGLRLASVDSPLLVGVPGRGEATSFPSVTLSPPVGSFGLSPLMIVGSSSANPAFEPLRMEIRLSACPEMRMSSVTKV
jgi:hypothetical protein